MLTNTKLKKHPKSFPEKFSVHFDRENGQGRNLSARGK